MKVFVLRNTDSYNIIKEKIVIKKKKGKKIVY